MVFGVYLLGFVFVFGWILCIGLIFGMVLMFVVNEVEVVCGVVMLVVYVFGLGVLFLVIVFFFLCMKGFINWMK